jgi:hypothetical protein
MSLEIFARQSLAQFTTIYKEIFKGQAIEPSELEALMWGKICAKDANITKLGFKIPYDNIKRAKVTLPYMPDDITYTGCTCIKKNSGLYTPCCAKVPEGEDFCKSCSYDKEGEAKDQEYGTTEDREKNVDNGRIKPITYAEWMKAKKITLPEIYAKLAAAGIQLEIPTPELMCRETPKRRKGRPTKEDESTEDEDKPKKPRGKKPKASESEDEAGSGSESDTSKGSKKAELPPVPPTNKPKAKKPKAKSESESEDEPKKNAKKTKAKSEDEPKAKAKKAPKEPKEPKKPKAKKIEEEKEEKTEQWTPKNDANDLSEEETEEEDCEVDGKDYTLRNSKFICDKDDGSILGTLVNGMVTWSSDRR